MSKELCDCGKVAVWDYMPGYSSGGNSYRCDNCVSRGCSCNYRYVDVNAYHPPLTTPDFPEGIEGKDYIWVEPNVWAHIDDNGREYPCAEYDYDPDGYEQ
jgi:MoaA/NifB/PqqE/SkfB family radical SAM enzyme